MKTIFLTYLALIALDASSEAARRNPKQKRSGYTFSSEEQVVLSPHLHVAQPSRGGWRPSSAPLQTDSGIDTYLPLPALTSTGDYNLKVNLPGPSPLLSIADNSIEKPVDEYQDFVPPQSIGTAVIPQMPPPAVPVNAAAANVPASTGAVFLGSGSLGVVSLGNGQYALGSGSLGYSQNRAQVRPTANVPVYPPLPATPNLIPAAVPSPEPPQPIPTYAQLPIPNSLDFNYQPLLSPSNQIPQQQQAVIDQNGYEFLQPERVRFGMPNPRPLMVRTRQQFATPTALQFQPQFQSQPQFQGQSQFLPPTGYDFSGY